MKTKILFLSAMLFSIAVFSQDVIAAWTFPTTSGAAPLSIAAECGVNSGSSNIYADGTNNSSTWTSNTSNYQFFTGVAPSSALCSVTAATGALSPTNSANNGKSIVIKTSTTGYKSIKFSYYTRGTSTGFSSQLWEYSTTGTSWTTITTITGTNVTSFSQKTVLDGTNTAFDNLSTLYLRVTLTGASSATGNNRFDNFVIEGTDVWVNLQWPQNLELNFYNSDYIYGQIYKPGVTDAAGQGSGISAWVGLNKSDTNPNTWAESSWKSAQYNTDSSNNDEYKAQIGFISATGDDYVLPGKYYYATRFQVDTKPYVYGGNKLISPNEGGFWDGTTYKSGTLTVLTELMPDTSCGATFTHPNNRIDAIPVPEANMYRFEFVENGNTTVITKSTNSVVWNELGAAMKYNTPYQVKVAWSTDSGSTWTNYGAACTITLAQTTYIYRGCGTTYTNPNMRVEALPLANATEYTFEFTNTTTNAVTEVVSTNPYTTFGAAAVPQGTYDIRAKAMVNGVYGTYGSVCNITYAIPLDTSKLLTTYCGTTMGHSNHRMDAEARTGATAWMFKFVEGSNTYEIASATNGINFAALGANLKYDTPYAISVKYQKDGVWSDYGASCNVSVSQLTYVYAGCGSTYTENIRIQTLPILNATEYTFEFGAGGPTFTSANPYITFATTGLAAGTYSIRVKAMANGVYADYGSACSITYGPAMARVSVFPNPFINSFTVDVKEAQVAIYDENGNLREEYKITRNAKPVMGTSLGKGLYFVHIKQQGAETKVLQVVKK